MILFLRDKLNRTILDVEVFTNENGDVDLSSSVIIKPYSDFLINNLEDDLKIIRDFSELQDLRGWLWERYKATVNKNPDKMEVVNQLRPILKKVAGEYNLRYVED